MSDQTLSLACVAIPDGYGRYLLVRKTGTKVYEFPGGELPAGGDATEVVVNECARQVGVHLNAATLTKLGTFTADAYEDPTTDIDATVFLGSGGALALPYDDIDALIWAYPGATAAPKEGRILSPLVNKVFGKLRPGVRRLRPFPAAPAAENGAVIAPSQQDN